MAFAVEGDLAEVAPHTSVLLVQAVGKIRAVSVPAVSVPAVSVLVVSVLVVSVPAVSVRADFETDGVLESVLLPVVTKARRALLTTAAKKI
jgi:hypothetical protein